MLDPKDEEFDLFVPESFKKALKAQIPRPFVFGPIDFVGLDLSEEEVPFDHEEQRDRIVSSLERTMLLPSNLCIHGFKVKAKLRTLKRKSTLLKHGRFLRNMEVYPIVPPEPEPVPEEGAEDEDED